MAFDDSLNFWSRLPTPISSRPPSPPTTNTVPSPKTSAFFASPFTPTSPTPEPPTNHTTSSAPSTANSAFFFAKGSATPTPPPSIHSKSESDVQKPLPPLLRFFPSRARIARDRDGINDNDDDEDDDLPTPTLPTPPISAPPLESPLPPPTPGTILGTDVPLQLIRQLGHGAFSSVWLALDADHILRGPRRRSQSFARRKEDRAVPGLVPHVRPRSKSIYMAQKDGDATAGGQLVAIKMIDRALCDADDRTRISFVREVEVLRHISHPSIVTYLHSFTTPTHHCLVLEALLGGELFDLLDQAGNHARLSEPLLRRIFGELCHAVAWMHSIGLVHRDLKLENILLTTNPFTIPSPPLASLPSPITKLTDFGLARFIDPASPLLTTRCGSESYAAPELITGRPYDGRATDAWACGVVLYALAAHALPFSHRMLAAEGSYTWGESAPRLATEGVRTVVGRLLVRDPEKRARVAEVWEEEWMRGEGAPVLPLARAAVEEDIPSVARQEL